MSRTSPRASIALLMVLDEPVRTPDTGDVAFDACVARARIIRDNFPLEFLRMCAEASEIVVMWHAIDRSAS